MNTVGLLQRFALEMSEKQRDIPKTLEELQTWYNNSKLKEYFTSIQSTQELVVSKETIGYKTMKDPSVTKYFSIFRDRYVFHTGFEISKEDIQSLNLLLIKQNMWCKRTPYFKINPDNSESIQLIYYPYGDNLDSLPILIDKVFNFDLNVIAPTLVEDSFTHIW